MSRVTFGITMGDPAGVGPEIILQGIMHGRIQPLGQHLVIGDAAVLEYLNEQLGYGLQIHRAISPDDLLTDPQTVNVLDLANIDLNELKPGQVQAQAGRAAVEYVERAIELAIEGKIDAIVTAPLNKEAMHLAGFKYPGHTEILAEKTGTTDYAMMLYSDKLKVIHVTTHLALEEACRRITRERVAVVIGLADQTMRKMGIAEPKIAVAGLNPHAGEEGIFGMQEVLEIGPAIKESQTRGINAEGPVPPDTVFVKAVQGKYDIVVVMYHDQGHIPVKLLAFDDGVNITTGLPIIRTSVDHGTAFDIAWQGIARENSLIQAVKAASRLSGQDTG